jgi:hypothetical protein
MARTLGDEGLRRQPSAAGLGRSRLFSWDRAARETQARSTTRCSSLEQEKNMNFLRSIVRNLGLFLQAYDITALLGSGRGLARARGADWLQRKVTDERFTELKTQAEASLEARTDGRLQRGR